MKEKDFDCYQRYTALKGVLDAAFPSADEASQDDIVRVLDVGAGDSRLSQDFLGPRYNVVRCDVAPFADNDGVVLTPGQPLPFADESFDAVVAMDVLEHVEPAQRRLFLRECARVAREVCVIAVPHGTRELDAAEARVYAVHKAYLGSHAFFEEHRDYGVPTPSDVMQPLAETGAAVASFPNVPLAAWEAFSCLDFVAYSDKECQHLSMLVHMVENDEVSAISANEEHYRRFYVTSRSSEIAQRIRQHVEGLTRSDAWPQSSCMFYPMWQLVSALCRRQQALDASVFQHQGEIRRLSELLQARESEFASRDSLVAAQTARADGYWKSLVEAQTALADRQRVLDDVLSSRTWRYTRLFRAAARVVRDMRRNGK